ncbi:MAG: hypothetical protein VX224_01645, partial [Candidatus Thermoplasmatota archaeon]|nr:hypothetical protein [Candidatus Thermoplasmatota archaeon]
RSHHSIEVRIRNNSTDVKRQCMVGHHGTAPPLTYHLFGLKLLELKAKLPKYHLTGIGEWRNV